MATEQATADLGEVERWIQRQEMPQVVTTFMNVLLNECTMDDSGNDAIFDIMAGILNADDEDAVFAAANAGSLSGKDYVDIPFFVKYEDVQWKISKISLDQAAGKFPFYALMRVVNMETGEYQTVSCGGVTFCTVLYKLRQVGAFDATDYDAGLPLVIRAKPAGLGNVLIPQKFVMPKMAESAGKAKK